MAFTAFNSAQTLIGWNHALHDNLSISWGATVTNYHTQHTPGSHFSPAQWTCPLLNSQRVYAMEQWSERNSFVHGGATLLATKSRYTRRLMADITSAYRSKSTVPIDERGHLFGIPLSTRLLQSPSTMEAWLLAIYRAGQHRLKALFHQDQRRQGSIPQFLTAHTAPRRHDKRI